MALADEAEEHSPRGLPVRVLIFDVETAPLHSYHWRVWKENIHPGQLQNHTWMLCWAAKWEGQKTVHSDSVTVDEAKGEDDSRIVASLADMVRKADVLIGHNVDRFDLPVLNTRLLDLKLDPLPPVRTVDTLKVAKKNFRFTWNRLSYLADFLGHESKHTMGFDDWLSAIKGSGAALSKMRAYCKHDVVVLENVWADLKPYARGLPRMVDAEHEMHRACPHCGAPFEALKPAGTWRTNASNFPKYRCGECGKESRARSATRGKKLALHPL